MSDSSGLSLELLAAPGMRAALAARDVASVYKILNAQGIVQRQIAALTGQSQSEVSEILNGRQVQAYDVLVRICEGLGIPRITSPKPSTSPPRREIAIKRRTHFVMQR